jgi:hypothetical protein
LGIFDTFFSKKEVPIPDLDTQQLVVNYAQAARSEAEAYMELVANRERELRAVASMILNPDSVDTSRRS